MNFEDKYKITTYNTENNSKNTHQLQPEPLKSLIKKLTTLPEVTVKTGVPLQEYTSFQVGGPADIFLIPRTIPAFSKVLATIHKKLPYFVLGRGSNIIVSDSGFRGAVICSEKINHLQIDTGKITAGAGITLSRLANIALENELSGLEFAAGIPGTLGGALYMNAGAYGADIKDILDSAQLLNHRGKSVSLSKSELQLDYRSSILQQKEYIAVEITLLLKKGNKSNIKALMKELNQKRRKKQPLDHPSAGSAFKRPQGNYAGKLIEEAGLKGTRVGDAMVSPKHAGFIINCGQATARDIKELMELVRKKVYQKSGITLEPEPRFIGDFD